MIGVTQSHWSLEVLFKVKKNPIPAYFTARSATPKFWPNNFKLRATIVLFFALPVCQASFDNSVLKIFRN